ncbi:MAG: FtsK/SpoIIIE domain-containing protein [Sulfuricurvum sp.]|uniref:FtsK/SpoIIIE domain-containing protein n=1 Tax=Sulfuricurvum sp. TaxID=2025608 RepID=UPI002632C280|nr:FtsK/SpoIIIE domain-containing protein [Sulfuricurvum sp.]MDD2829112.1 FtsK/SpoIIIE domain-containing protein [Sulfuricurvum sp.]MDD4948860.1 FtsK/SpoIIIE domain-containing protein [Sulfuricurvum sp.]
MKKEIIIGKFKDFDENAVVGFDFDKSLIAVYEGQNFQASATVLENIVLQLVTSLPPFGTKITLYENMPSHSFSYLKILCNDQNNIGKQLFTPNEINHFLGEINTEIAKRYAQFANVNVKTIEQNNQTARIPLPYHFIVISDLTSLVNQNGQMIQILRNIFETGANAGVFMILNHDHGSANRLNLNEQSQKNFYTLLSDVVSNLQGFNFLANVIPFNNHPEYQKFILKYGYKPVFKDGFAKTLKDNILEQIKVNEEKAPNKDFIKTKFGESGGRDIFFAMGAATHTYHAMISGTNGSGKTSMVQNLLCTICENYSPKDINLLLLDFGGATFHPYQGIAHIPYVFYEPSDTEKAKRTLEYIGYELERRKKLFVAAGIKHGITVDSLDKYKKYEQKSLPRLIIIIDEFGTLMEKRELINYTEKNINLIAREGRKHGMHLVLITQSFRTVAIPADVKGNASMRLALRANTSNDATAILDQGNDMAYNIRNFQAVLNNDGGRSHANIIVDLDFIDEEYLIERQKNLKTKYKKEVLSEVEHYLNNADASINPSNTYTSQNSWR